MLHVYDIYSMQVLFKISIWKKLSEEKVLASETPSRSDSKVFALLLNSTGCPKMYQFTCFLILMNIKDIQRDMWDLFIQ